MNDNKLDIFQFVPDRCEKKWHILLVTASETLLKMYLAITNRYVLFLAVGWLAKKWAVYFKMCIHPTRALRALGLLLADGVLTVGRGRTF